MTQEQKQQIVSLINEHIKTLGSQARVAKKAGVSEATISLLRNGKWDNLDGVWTKTASALGWRSSDWHIASNTINMQMLTRILDDSKRYSMFQAVSERAGMGKSAGLKYYEQGNRVQGVYMLTCREWAKREFLQQLAQSVGVETHRAQSVDSLLMSVVAFFNARRAMRPLLILDEADKLRPAALRALITLFNECEDGLGIVISGTEHLSRQMRNDARHQRKGGDELLSRFGGHFHKLVGTTLADVRAIAAANGITSKEVVDAIWHDAKPVSRMFGERNVMVIDDLRALKRAIQRELIKGTELSDVLQNVN